MPRFKKGNKGRPKGATNKTNAELRQAIQKVIDNNLDTLQDDLEELDAKERIKMLIDFMRLVLPRQKEIETTEMNTEPIVIDFKSLIEWTD